MLVDRTVEDSEFDTVSADNVASAREGCRHLISLGHLNITLLVSDPNLRNISERIQGYCEAMAEAGLSKFIRVVVGGMTSDQAHKALQRAFLLYDQPSAVFTATHVMALGALRAIWEAGLVLPETISLLAFDDCEWMTALRPFLSTLCLLSDNEGDCGCGSVALCILRFLFQDLGHESSSLRRNGPNSAVREIQTSCG